MTNGARFIEQAARRAQTLPLPRIAAAVLGVSAAFFALAMPGRIVSGLFGLTGVSVGVGLVVRLLFATLFALLAAAVGWLSLTLIAGDSRPAAIVRAPRPVRKRAVPATSSDPAPTLRRGDAHPDAPSRRPIFAKDDLGTPFDEIVTDRRILHAAPEAASAMSDAPVERDAVIAGTPAVTAEAETEEPRAADLPVTPEPIPEPIPGEVPHAAAEPEAPLAAPADVSADEPAEAAPPADPPVASGVAAPREDDSIAALMARFEGGLGRLGGGTLPPPDPAALNTLKRSARDPDEALRDALEALQQMAARQR